jgi:predicted transcriptional regulator
MDSNEIKIMIKRLEDIRNLLVLIANKSGATQDEISILLGINERTVRKWLNPKSAR